MKIKTSDISPRVRENSEAVCYKCGHSSWYHWYSDNPIGRLLPDHYYNDHRKKDECYQKDCKCRKFIYNNLEGVVSLILEEDEKEEEKD